MILKYEIFVEQVVQDEEEEFFNEYIKQNGKLNFISNMEGAVLKDIKQIFKINIEKGDGVQVNLKTEEGYDT